MGRLMSDGGRDPVRMILCDTWHQHTPRRAPCTPPHHSSLPCPVVVVSVTQVISAQVPGSLLGRSQMAKQQENEN